MASVSVEITTKASPETVWDAIRDIGALHTRLVPGFVVHTELEQRHAGSRTDHRLRRNQAATLCGPLKERA